MPEYTGRGVLSDRPKCHGCGADDFQKCSAIKSELFLSDT
jgi:hypothetical protein